MSANTLSEWCLCRPAVDVLAVMVEGVSAASSSPMNRRTRPRLEQDRRQSKFGRHLPLSSGGFWSSASSAWSWAALASPARFVKHRAPHGYSLVAETLCLGGRFSRTKTGLTVMVRHSGTRVELASVGMGASLQVADWSRRRIWLEASQTHNRSADRHFTPVQVACPRLRGRRGESRVRA